MKVKLTLPGGAVAEVDGTPVEVKAVLRDLLPAKQEPVFVPAFSVSPPVPITGCQHEFTGLGSTGGSTCRKCGSPALPPFQSWTWCSDSAPTGCGR